MKAIAHTDTYLQHGHRLLGEAGVQQQMLDLKGLKGLDLYLCFACSRMNAR